MSGTKKDFLIREIFLLVLALIVSNLFCYYVISEEAIPVNSFAFLGIFAADISFGLMLRDGQRIEKYQRHLVMRALVLPASFYGLLFDFQLNIWHLIINYTLITFLIGCILLGLGIIEWRRVRIA